jgi:hypothetical protein
MRWLIAIVAGLVALALVGCSTLLPAVPMDPAQAPAAPPDILGAYGDDAPIASAADWERRRAPLLRAAFAEHLYGPSPPNAAPTRLLSRDAVAYPRLSDAVVEQWSVGVGDADRPLHFNMVVLLPRDAAGPVPIIVMENFCGNRVAMPDAPDQIAAPLTPLFPACNWDWAQPLVESIFGDRINGPDFESVLARGYGLAFFYAGDVVGDEPESAAAGMAQLYGDRASEAGAIAVWAWLYSEAYNVLAADARVDAARVAVWGHSRNAKAALLAAAMDPRIAAVIAHQSGRGGAALNRSTRGEQIDQMMEEYPYWFPQAFAAAPEAEPMFDQHDLIALIAPRPVLLGNGARDAWADPLGAWAAAEAATPVYALYGVEGLDQTDMRTPNPDARIWYYTRAGLHGVTSGDWAVFLDFLDARMGPHANPPRAP